VNGVLAISRAFGDNQFKTRRSEKNMRSLVIAIPEITTELVTPMTEFLIIASDGLWDVMSPQTAVNFVRNSFSKRHNLEEAAQLLVREAIAIGSVDNVSAVIMSFHLPDTENT
jgi:serine/threonine protein phosphatase PrpC